MLVVCSFWIIFLFCFAEEPWSLLRLRRWPVKEWVADRKEGKAIRVVSLNCGGGIKAATEEVAEYDPDIVLLQESPGRNTVESLAKQLFGESAGVLWGVDTSILVRGKILPKPIIRERRSAGVWAKVELANGLAVEIFSIRFIPPIIRMDLWSSDCWRSQAENRRFRQHQVDLIAEKVETIPDDVPVIVGGDFNAPAGDGAMRRLKSRLQDTFPKGGIGWGNTGINELPVARVDQVWVSDHFEPMAVVARKTRHSDHRMVICDLLIRSFPATKPWERQRNQKK